MLSPMIACCCAVLNGKDASGCMPVMDATPLLTVICVIAVLPHIKRGDDGCGILFNSVPSGNVEKDTVLAIDFCSDDGDELLGIQTKAASKTKMVTPAAMHAIPNWSPNFRWFFRVLDAWLIFSSRIYRECIPRGLDRCKFPQGHRGRAWKNAIKFQTTY